MDTHENKSVDGLQFAIEVGYGVIDLRGIIEEANVHRAEDEDARLDIENDHYGQLCDLRAAAVAEAENEAFIEWVEREQVRQNVAKIDASDKEEFGTEYTTEQHEQRQTVIQPEIEQLEEWIRRDSERIGTTADSATAEQSKTVEGKHNADSKAIVLSEDESLYDEWRVTNVSKNEQLENESRDLFRDLVRNGVVVADAIREAERHRYRASSSEETEVRFPFHSWPVWLVSGWPIPPRVFEKYDSLIDVSDLIE